MKKQQKAKRKETKKKPNSFYWCIVRNEMEQEKWKPKNFLNRNEWKGKKNIHDAYERKMTTEAKNKRYFTFAVSKCSNCNFNAKMLFVTQFQKLVLQEPKNEHHKYTHFAIICINSKRRQCIQKQSKCNSSTFSVCMCVSLLFCSLWLPSSFSKIQNAP